MWGMCRGQNVLSPLETIFSSLDEVFACFALPPCTWRPLSLGAYSSVCLYVCLSVCVQREGGRKGREGRGGERGREGREGGRGGREGREGGRGGEGGREGGRGGREGGREGGRGEKVW